MAKREMNKGWKIFAIIMLTLFVAVGIFCAVVGIAAAVNHTGFVDQFKTWFKIAENSEEAEAVVEAAKLLLRR